MRTQVYKSSDSSKIVVIAATVIQHVVRWRQDTSDKPEVAGELFSPRWGEGVCTVTEASGPDPKDCNSRHRVLKDPVAGTRERERQWQEHGHVPVGLWHTHPQIHPRASLLDLETTLGYLHDLGGDCRDYLQLIVGTHGHIALYLVHWDGGHEVFRRSA